MSWSAGLVALHLQEHALDAGFLVGHEEGVRGWGGHHGDKDDDGEMLELGARSDEDRAQDGDKEEGGAELGLHGDQGDGDEGDDRRGNQADEGAVVFSEAQVPRDDQDVRDFRDLAGLEVHRAQVDPASSAVAGAHD